MSASAALRSIMRRHQGTLENRRLEEASLSWVLKIQAGCRIWIRSTATFLAQGDITISTKRV